MAVKAQVYGIDELVSGFESAEKAAQGIAKAALYEGAGVMADAMHAALDNIATEDYYYAHHGQKRLPSPEMVEAVKSARFGVAKHEGSGSEVSTVVGIAGSGYVEMLGKNYPAAMLLRSIQSGTSFMTAQPVVRRAINRTKGAAAAAIKAEAEARIKKIFED